jgi:hypothetical protein
MKFASEVEEQDTGATDRVVVIESFCSRREVSHAIAYPLPVNEVASVQVNQQYNYSL